MNTSKTKHTPGPWRYVADASGRTGGSVEDANGKSVTTTQNASLIAAAPDLLAALQWALEYVEDDLCPDHQAALTAAHAAVKRATEQS